MEYKPLGCAVLTHDIPDLALCKADLGAWPESAILPNFGPKPRLEFGAEGRISGFSAGLLGTMAEMNQPDGLEVEFIKASGETRALVLLTAVDVKKAGLKVRHSLPR